jgi:hypothetical protein
LYFWMKRNSFMLIVQLIAPGGRRYADLDFLLDEPLRHA